MLEADLPARRCPSSTERARRWSGSGGGGTLGLASSSNREIIDLFLDLSGLREQFAVTVSSEEVERGKPAPDVYLEALSRLGAAPAASTAVEDSDDGIRAARAAGMRVVALPNPAYPPGDEALGLADAVIGSLRSSPRP